MTLGTAGTTHGSTEAIGADGTIHGIMATPDGTVASGVRIMPDGTADGIRSGQACITDILAASDRDITMDRSTPTHGEVRDIRPALTGSSQAGQQAEAA